MLIEVSITCRQLQNTKRVIEEGGNRKGTDGRGFKRCPVPGLCRRQPGQCWECWSWGPQREYKLLTFLYAPDLSQHKIDISTPEYYLLLVESKCTHWLKDPRLKSRGSSQFKLECYPCRLVDIEWIIMHSTRKMSFLQSNNDFNQLSLL